MNRKVTLAAAATLALALGAAYWVFSAGKAAPPPAVVTAATPEPSAAEPSTAEPAASLAPAPAPPRPAGNGRFDLQEDGSPVPPLPDDAPARIKMGVALFAYEGAQGVPGQLRTRDAAVALARKAIGSSEGQFAKILAQADPGSGEDVGWIRRGVLERRVERAVFSLEKGTTSKEPIDTPRGFWVVRRTQ